MKSLFFLFLFSSSLVFAQDLQWIKLMHYQKTISGWESEIDSPSFFLHPNGKYDPDAELATTLDKFINEDINTPEEQAAICRFPARYSWLKDKHKLKARPCPRFQRWFDTLKGNSVSLVFSSYFLNNPSSSFGHTLLRVNKSASVKDGRRYELLDYGINYAANADTSNALFYAVKGLFGGFPGTFTTMPYYYKVREYNNAESRDLWEYELSLTPAQVDLILAHVWEVGPNSADYWYLTENCSYFMIALLEVGDPNLKLTDNLKKYIIPSDTVQVVWNTPGLVRDVKYRPSVRTEFFYRANELDREEQKTVSKLVFGRNAEVIQNISDETKKRKILDAAIDLMDYRYSHEVQKQDSEQAKYKSILLSERGKIDQITETLKITPPEVEQPHMAHGSRRMMAGLQSSRYSGNFLHLQYKFALHDQLDPVVGYPEYAQISFFDINATYSDKLKKLELDNFAMFEVVSHTPINLFTKSLSWRIKAGAEKIWDENCPSCHGGAVTGGAGYTLQLPTSFITTFFFGLHAASYWIPKGPSDRFLLGAGPQARARVRLTKDLIFLAEATFRNNLKKDLLNYQESMFAIQKTLNLKSGIRASWETKGKEEFMKVDGVFYY